MAAAGAGITETVRDGGPGYGPDATTYRPLFIVGEYISDTGSFSLKEGALWCGCTKATVPDRPRIEPQVSHRFVSMLRERFSDATLVAL